MHNLEPGQATGSIDYISVSTTAVGAVLCYRKPPSLKKFRSHFFPLQSSLTYFVRVSKCQLLPSEQATHLLKIFFNIQHRSFLKNQLLCEMCLSVLAKNVECTHTLSLAFSSPTNNNSTDLNLETLKATVHELPAVYQNTSSCAGMEKSAVSLDTAISWRTVHFLFSLIFWRVVSHFNHTQWIEFIFLKKLMLIIFHTFSADHRVQISGHAKGYHYMHEYFHNSVSTEIFCIITHRVVVISYRHFRTTYQSYLQG